MHDRPDEFRVVIPARWASSRLPGKPLAEIAGRPMIAHVWERARASGAGEVVIASDDARVLDAAAAFGADVASTDPEHPSGTDRIAEVARRRGWPDDVVLVNVQGDEPLVPAAVIRQVARNLIDRPQVGMATLAEPLEEAERLFDPNVVKVVCRDDGRALYFSRAPIPWDREAFEDTGGPQRLTATGVWRRHLGIYAYRVGLLRRFVTWAQSPLERIEMLEQLRVLHAGVDIHVADACEPVPQGVDTPADLARVRAYCERAGRE